MFSEYASRFLAQSQSRLSFAPSPDRERRQGNERSRRQDQGTWRSATASRLNSQRAGNPYQPTSSQISGFPFVSRLNNTPQAPLFYSATDEFREENDEEEHEREIADFYALQKSRRHLGGSDLKESLEGGDASGSSLDGSSRDHDRYEAGFGKGGGIRSSWRGGATSTRGQGPHMDDLDESPELTAHDGHGNDSPLSRGRMSDIRLEDTIRSEIDDEPPEDLMGAAPVQRLRSPVLQQSLADSERNGLLRGYAASEVDGASVPEGASPQLLNRPRHDAYYGHLYLLAVGAMFASWFLVWLHTDKPDDSKKPLGDTIYATLRGSFHLLGVYTVVSILVALLWLATLRAYVRLLVYTLVVSVPIILLAFTLYPLISSFQGSWNGKSLQDVIMRWAAFVPAVILVLWMVAVVRGRHSMHKAISILEFATKILGANPALLLVGFSTLGVVVGFTWLWLAMFARVFLQGHLATESTITKFIIDTGTWWLGIYFGLIYIWTVGMILALQRAITSATVSQWYFHRLAVPSPSSQTIVKAAVTHSTTTLFGTIALSTGISMLVRLPLILLPHRLKLGLELVVHHLIPGSIAAMINPLTLTYAAIHSQPLGVSSRGLAQLHFLSPTHATTPLHPNTFKNQRGRDGWSRDATPLRPYRLSKLILHATRSCMSMALGFAGWVSTARSLKLAGTGGLKGSLYAYVVGLIAGAIGYIILGSVEDVFGCIVDAVVVCWASEVGSSGQGEVRYCREAAYLFGGEHDQDQDQGQVELG